MVSDSNTSGNGSVFTHQRTLLELSSGLSLYATKALWFLSTYCHFEELCFATETIGTATGVARQNVSRALKELRVARIIVDTGRSAAQYHGVKIYAWHPRIIAMRLTAVEPTVKSEQAPTPDTETPCTATTTPTTASLTALIHGAEPSSTSSPSSASSSLPSASARQSTTSSSTEACEERTRDWYNKCIEQAVAESDYDAVDAFEAAREQEPWYLVERAEKEAKGKRAKKAAVAAALQAVKDKAQAEQDARLSEETKAAEKKAKRTAKKPTVKRTLPSADAVDEW